MKPFDPFEAVLEYVAVQIEAFGASVEHDFDAKTAATFQKRCVPLLDMLDATIRLAQVDVMSLMVINSIKQRYMEIAAQYEEKGQ